MKAAILKSRGIVRISGADARDWLQSLITNDIGKAGGERACFAALLSPQGKILFDFLISADGEDYLLDCARDQASALSKRLRMYKLRAKVAVTDTSDELAVLAIWDMHTNPAQGAIRDPRAGDLGWRMAIAAGSQPDGIAINADEKDYDRLRILAGVPLGGRDFAWGDIFPHDANMDELDGVDFKKGCYIGQEVVSRVQHRGSARKRFRTLTIKGDAADNGTEIKADDASIGAITSIADGHGLGLIRIDRAGEAQDAGIALTAGGASVTIRKS